MGEHITLQRSQQQMSGRGGRRSDGVAAGLGGSIRLDRDDCLEQLLLAFRDIADRDDIHQAAERLAAVQQWIHDEAERAAADPIFADLLPV